MVMREEGVTVVRKCDRRFVGWWGGVMVMGRSKGREEVHHLTESVTVIREVLKVLTMNVS